MLLPCHRTFKLHLQRLGAWAEFVAKTPIGNHIAIDSAYETPTPTPSSPPLMNALHYKAAYWVGQGVFDSLSSFSEFESRVNDIFEEKDRGDVFEIFIEAYLATQTITQHVRSLKTPDRYCA